MATIAYGPRTRAVHANGDRIGVATWSPFRRTWTFSPRGIDAEVQYASLDGEEYETRLELGEALSLASKLDLTAEKAKAAEALVQAALVEDEEEVVE